LICLKAICFVIFWVVERSNVFVRDKVVDYYLWYIRFRI